MNSFKNDLTNVMEEVERTPDPPGDNYLLLFAIDEYRNTKNGFSRLNNCWKDVNEVKQVLVEKYNFTDEKTIFLRDAEATRKAILAQLIEIGEKINEHDSLIIMFSGHGERVPKGDDSDVSSVGYLIPYDARLGQEDEYISHYDLISRLNRINCRHLLLIIDACFSGEIFHASTNRESYSGRNDERRNSRWGISASHSRERASDGDPTDHSPFARQLIDVLKKNKESISIQKLSDEIRINVYTKYVEKQTPIGRPINVAGDGLGIFTLHPKGKSPTDFAYLITKWKNDPSPSNLDVIYEYLHLGEELPREFLQDFALLSHKAALPFYEKSEIQDQLVSKLNEFHPNGKLETEKFYRLIESNEIKNFIESLEGDTEGKKFLKKEIVLLKDCYSTFEVEPPQDPEGKSVEYNSITAGWLILLKYLENYKSLRTRIRGIKDIIDSADEDQEEEAFKELHLLISSGIDLPVQVIKEIISITNRFHQMKKNEIGSFQNDKERGEMREEVVSVLLSKILPEI